MLGILSELVGTMGRQIPEIASKVGLRQNAGAHMSALVFRRFLVGRNPTGFTLLGVLLLWLLLCSAVPWTGKSSVCPVLANKL